MLIMIFTIISWAIKVRAELIDLNNKIWLIGKVFIYFLWNLQQNVAVFYFMARCPILLRNRLLRLGKILLNFEELVSFMNGRDWRSVCLYLYDAWQYRRDLNSEFTFYFIKIIDSFSLGLLLFYFGQVGLINECQIPKNKTIIFFKTLKLNIADTSL